MKTYKAPNNSLHAIEPEFAHMLPAGCVEITESEAEAIRISNTPMPQIPRSVTMRQARLALLQSGKLQAVDNAIAAMIGPSGDAARIEWEFSSEVHRNKALVQSLAPTLGMNDEQLDALFTLAATL